MLHALLPAYIHRQSDEHLLELISACERALLDGTSTHGDMTTLIECEKEMMNREHVRVRRTIAGVRPLDKVSVSLSDLAAKNPVNVSDLDAAPASKKAQPNPRTLRAPKPAPRRQAARASQPAQPTSKKRQPALMTLKLGWRK